MMESSLVQGADLYEDSEQKQFLLEKHKNYIVRCLRVLPSSAQMQDTHKLTVAFFCLSALDLLDAIELAGDLDVFVDWIYSHQILQNSSGSNLARCGFRGSSTNGVPSNPELASDQSFTFDSSHITMTYNALAMLLILGDDLSRVDKPAVLAGLKALQLPSGSFCASIAEQSDDMRFVFCACCISRILNDWSAVDVPRTVAFIRSSKGYDGAFGQAPFLESHGGSTFCAVASLVLMEQLDAVLSPCEVDRLMRWCLRRQQTGFQGRPNKPVDTCYSFWVGACLQLLGGFEFCEAEFNRSFLLSTQDELIGGFGKSSDCIPDPLHTFFGIAGFSLLGVPGVKPINCALIISLQASAVLQTCRTVPRSRSILYSEVGSVSSGSSSSLDTPVPLVTEAFSLCLHRAALQLLSDHSQTLTSRLTVLHFCLSSLDILGDLAKLDRDIESICEWTVESYAAVFSNGHHTESQANGGLDALDPIMCSPQLCFSVVALFLILKQNPRHVVDVSAFCCSIQSFQHGRFASVAELKSIHAYVCLAVVLGCLSSVDTSCFAGLIIRFLKPDGAFGLMHDDGSNDESTFYAISSLSLIGKLHVSLSEAGRSELLSWCLLRSREAGSPSDGLLWNCCTLKILGGFRPSLSGKVRAVVSAAISGMTFTSANPTSMWHSLATLSLIDEPGLLPLSPALQCPQHVVVFAHSIGDNNSLADAVMVS